MDFTNIKTVYLLGIGGIGMSGLARYFNFSGKFVAGFDRTPSDLTNKMKIEGIEIHFEDDLNYIPKEILETPKENLLVIYTPAIPKDHIEKKWFLENGFTLYKRSEVLGLISRNFNTIAIAGTHGKTTTSCIIAHLLNESKVGCSAFLGGVSVNFGSNLLLNNSKNLVVEADEFDRSFLTLSPNVAVLTSTDADHLDIYGDATNVKQSYLDFTNKIMPHGKLVVREGLDIIPKLTTNYYTYEVLSSGESRKADFSATLINIAEGLFIFNISTPFGNFEKLSFSYPGRHNLENAVAAIATALLSGASMDEIRKGLATFLGVKRRFEYVVKKPQFVFIDDYAHHPSELRACISAIKEIYPNKKITGVFQPHLFSRTRDFADDFANSLGLLDSVILLDIYPARELPIAGISSTWLLGKIKSEQKILCSKQDLTTNLLAQNPEILVTLGAGDIDRMVQPIKKGFGY
jgi:UDP-N-acetylmuramate--alanine ligase